MGSLAAPHFVHSSARADAEGAERGSLDRSDLKRNSALLVRRSHHNLLVPIYRALQGQSYARVEIGASGKLSKSGVGGKLQQSLRKIFAIAAGLIALWVQRDDAAFSRISFSTRSTSAGTSTLIAS